MSSDYLTHVNSALAEFRKTEYLDTLATYPYPDQAPLYSMIPHKQDYHNNSYKWKTKMSTLDGVAFESISLDSPVYEGDEASVDFKKMYQTIEFERMSTMIMKDKRSSAINLVQEALKAAANERALTIESMLVGSDSTGEIGTIDTSGVVDNGSGSYTCTVSAATWAYGQFRRRLMLNVGTSSDVFEITEIDDVNHKVTILRRTGGTKVPTDGDKLYRQRGRNNYPGASLKEIIEGSSALHGITRKHGWQSLKVDWSNEAISEQKLLELFLKTYARALEYPDMLLLSPAQMIRLQRVLRDSSVSTRSAYASRTTSEGKSLSYEIPNVTYLNLGGKEVKLLSHHCLANGTGYFVNTKHLELMSIGPGDFVSPILGLDGTMEYMGNKTGADRYRTLWAYYYAFRTTRPEAHSGFTGAITTQAEGLF
jgi:hypothetical protein